MKVAFYIGRLNRGGAETLLADIFNSESLPFEAVCVYRSEGNISESFHSANVPMIRLPRKKSWLLYTIRMRKLLLREHVDIVHAQTSLNAIIAILCTMFTPIKVVNTFHGFSFAHAHKLLRRFVFKGCDRMVFVSDYERQYYLKRGGFGAEKKCCVVYNGVNFDKFPIVQKPEKESKTVEMCMVGSFGSGRNHIFVCRFLHKLKEKGYDFHFSFIGGARDSERGVYEQCVSYCKENDLMDNVTFVGLSNDVPKLLSTMDAFVYATRHDSFGIAVIEAISAGLPTFVNDWEVMNEITHQGNLATLYMTNDEESLCSAYDYFVNHRDECWDKAHESAMAVREQYAIKNHIAGLAEVYAEIICNKKDKRG